jgi:hypothetical protein
MARFRVCVLPSLALLALASLLSCEIVHGKEGLLLPVGRLPRAGNVIEVAVDALPFKAQFVSDYSGGYWLKLPFSALKNSQKVQLRFFLSELGTVAHDDGVNVARWTSPQGLIDSDNPAIVAEAKKLTAGSAGDDEKAKAILKYVQSLPLQVSAGMHRKKASQTLAEGSGICVNHSRLYVALCRASGVPARSVSGLLAGPGQDGHHEWAEYFDRRKEWYPVDPTGEFDFSEGSKALKHVDLVYDIESNPFYPFDRGWEKDSVTLKGGDISVFCADWARQEWDGQMSYARRDSGGSDAVELQVEYDLSKYRIE